MLFMDVTDILRHYPSALDLAFQIKNEVRQKLGFTVNVGISSNKLLAKQASDFTKPDRVHLLFPEEIKEKLWKLPPEELFGVGRATKKKLDKLEIHTIGEIANADPLLLRQHMKIYGNVIWERANGIDESPVIPCPPANKGYGNSVTTSFDVETTEQAHLVLLGLCETIGLRLRRDNAEIQVVAVSIRYQDSLSWASRQTTLTMPTDVTDEIYRASVAVLDRLWDGKQTLRQLGVHISQVSRNSWYQMELFGNRDKKREMDRTVDRIRQRYGKRSVMRCSFLLNANVDPMSGGISEDRRRAL